jgi:predicted nucleic acid-binding Zn ribbon protein
VSDFKSVGAIVNREKTRIWKTNPGLELQSLWEKVTGPDIARNTSVRSMRRGIMTVGCSSSAWACELKLSGRELVLRINRLKPPEPINEIRFIHQAHARPKTRK